MTEKNSAKYIVYTIVGITELFLLIRLLLKLIGADINNLIVSKFYLLTENIVDPFNNVVGIVALKGPRENMIFEPGNILAIIIIVFIGWVIIDILSIRNIKRQQKPTIKNED